MPKSNRYPDIYQFGRRLIKTGDLDPVYILLWNSKFSKETLRRWLLAYWCFYHVGTASWIAEGNFWERMKIAAGSKEYPRSSERRHYRGQQALKSVMWLKANEPLFIWEKGDEYTVSQIMEQVQMWRGFGPWVSFKVADMLERLDICGVEFDKAAMFLFDSPREATNMLWKLERGSEIASDQTKQNWAVNKLIKKFSDLKAPPRFERGINAQEAETVLCKWKSACNGHYHVGKDIKELREALGRFENSISKKLWESGNKEGWW